MDASVATAPRPHRVLHVVLIAVLTSAVVAITPEVARADLATTPAPSWMVNGTVHALARAADRIFIGGSFTEIRQSPTGGPSVAVRNLAAIDADTGAVIADWNPMAFHTGGGDGAVYDIAVSPDGGTVYVGGAFTSVGGVKHNRLAAIDAATGVVSSWSPNVAWKVRAVAVSDRAVYVGGDFQSVNGQPRLRLAAFDAASGALNAGWKPSADGRVNVLAIAPGGAQVVIGGDFSTIDGIARRGLARVDSSTGSLDASWTPNITGPQPLNVVFDVVVTSNRVFAAVGGPNNFVAAYDAASGVAGAQLWRTWADGDVQTIAMFRSKLIVGGHFVVLDNVSHVRLARLDSASGDDDLSWRPTLNSYYGPWDIESYGTAAIFVGGQFTSVSGTAQWRIAKFPFVDSAPPSAPTDLAATDVAPDHVSLAWTASTDDVGVVNYRIYRDGVEMATIGDTTSYVDTAVEPDVAYLYEVSALDAFAESPRSNPAFVTTTRAGGPLHQDDFEGGDLSRWSGCATTPIACRITVQSDVVYAGAKAARATTTGPATFAYHDLTENRFELSWRVDLHLISRGPNKVGLGQFATAGGNAIATLYVSPTGRLGLRNNGAGAGATDTSGGPIVSLGEWHELVVHVIVDGTQSRVDVLWDDASVSALSRSFDLGTVPIGRFYLGERVGNRSYDVAFDDHALETGPVV
jgi:hypothetical protein